MRYSSESQRKKSLKRWGDPVVRFWRRVSVAGGCWLWRGATGKTSPYGVARWGKLQTTAHRVAFLVSGGKLLPGQLVLHFCDNPLCVRPTHLFPGTHQENMDDCIRKGRAARGRSLNHPLQVGELNHAAKVSNATVAEMRDLFFQGWSQADLMRRFGVTRANVHCIVRNKSRVS
jgi:HNH endonuclease